MRRAVAGVVAGLVVLAGAVPAHAWTIEVEPWEPAVLIQGAPGEVHSLTISGAPPPLAASWLDDNPTAPGHVLVHDRTASLTGVGRSCRRIDDHTAHCIGIQTVSRPTPPDGEPVEETSPAPVRNIRATLGDGDDRVTMTPGISLYLIAHTGAGNDTITGLTNFGANILAGPGDDRVNLRGNGGAPDKHGSTRMDLEEGDDLLNVANGWTDDDDFGCDEGFDTVYHDAGDVPLRDDCEVLQVKPAPPRLP